jgi:hypothetical protein
MRWTTAASQGAALVALLSVPRPAAASLPSVAHSYVIAIGFNGVPGESGEGVDRLRYADDDAIAFAGFMSGADQVHLLTILDAETQRRLGDTAPAVRPPNLGELHRAVKEIARALDADVREGAESSVYLYYGGHGTDASGQAPELALLDGGLTRDVLYDDVLASLPATHVHLFVDACHAEAVVRPRDAQATLVETTSDDVAQIALRSTLARFPAVGAILASTRGAQAHEWDRFGGGVFTHELLSALRGAADVDGNGRIEYSEVAAFLSAANAAVTDPRAHMDPVVHAPIAEPRVAIVDLSARHDDAVLEGRIDGDGLLWVEDERGDRVVDIRSEAGSRVRLSVPASRVLYLHSARGEASVRLSPASRVDLGALVFGATSLPPRDAVASALRSGVFATPYGRSYYRGFVGGANGWLAVPLPVEDAVLVRDEATGHFDRSSAFSLSTATSSTATSSTATRTHAWVALSGAGALAVAAGVFGALALQAHSEFDGTSFERPATDASRRYTQDTATFAALAGGAVVSSVVGAVLWWQSSRGRAPASATSVHPFRLSLEF